MNIYAIAASALCASFLAISIKKISPELSHIISFAACVMIFLAVLPSVSEIVRVIREFSELYSGGIKYMTPIFKITAIAYISQMAAELCEDAGEKALSGRVEMAGKIAICFVTLPIAREAFITIAGILK